MAQGNAEVIRQRALESSGEARGSVGTTNGEYRVACEVGAAGRVWAVESCLDSMAGSTAYGCVSLSS